MKSTGLRKLSCVFEMEGLLTQTIPLWEPERNDSLVPHVLRWVGKATDQHSETLSMGQNDSAGKTDIVSTDVLSLMRKD